MAVASDFNVYKSTTLYSIGVFGSKVIMFLLIPICSFFFNKSELGQYDLILVTTAFLTPLLTLQLSDGVYRFLLGIENVDEKKVVISTSLNGILINFVIYSILFMGFTYFVNIPYSIEFLFLQFSSCLFIYFQQLVRGIGKNSSYAVMGVLNSMLVIAMSIPLLYFGYKVSGILIALFASHVITIVYIVIKDKIFLLYDFRCFDFQKFKELFRYSIPLLPNALSWWMIDLFNRYIILWYLSEEYNGIYAVASRYASMLALVNSVVILSWQDMIIMSRKGYSELNSDATLLFKKLFIFEITLIILLTSYSNYIIEFTTNQEFYSAKKYFPILLLTVGLSFFCAFLGAFYLKEKKTKKIFVTTLIGGVINILISVLLIDEYGLYSVCVGSICGFLTTFILRNQETKLKLPFLSILGLMVLYVIVLYIKFYGEEHLNFAILILTPIIFLILNKGIIYKIYYKLNKFI